MCRHSWTEASGHKPVVIIQCRTLWLQPSVCARPRWWACEHASHQTPADWFQDPLATLNRPAVRGDWWVVSG